MDDWEKINETSLLKKEDFYSHLNMEYITDAGYTHAKGVRFQKKKAGEYYDLCVESDALLLTDVLEKFQNKCLELYELISLRFLTAAGLAWQAALKKTKVKLDLLTVDMLLMVEKGIRGGTCHTIPRYAKANNKYLKIHEKNKESSHKY